MKKLFRATNDNNQPIYAFEFGGTAITNPIVSECSRFSVNPEYYGFAPVSTGCGNTAHAQDFELDGKTIRMMITNDGNQIDKDTIIATVWLTDGGDTDHESIGESWEVTR
jgi:hypothetical protein